MSDQSSGEDDRGYVVGYEMQVVCPECGYPTDVDKAGPDTPITCGEDFEASEEHGCGRELVVTVSVE